MRLAGMRRSLCRGLWRAVFFLVVWPAWGAEPPSAAPILRIETGRHSAAINRLALVPKGNEVITVSDDKTARIWSLATGAAGRVLRVPIGSGQEGALYAIGLSPSGNTVAVAGHTGLSWDRTSSIYLFERVTGKWIGRIALGPGPTDAVNHLLFSPNGRFIAVAANDSRGLRIVEPATRSMRIVDADYRDAIVWLDFAADGRLVASSADGGVRLYDPEFRRTASWRAPAGQRPWSVAFSPDGRKIAVGYIGLPKVTVLSTRDLGVLQELTGAKDRSGGLSTVAWAADGKSLYAAGTYGSESGRKAARRWPFAGGQALDIEAGDDTVTDLKALPGGGIVYATAEPAWGVIGPDNRLGLRNQRAQADFRDGYVGGFDVSADGSQVSFGFAQGGKRRARFDLLAGTLETDRRVAAGPVAADDKGANASVSNWRNGRSPRIGDIVLRLDPGETSRSVAVTVDGGVALGTDYFIRFYRNGRLAWRTEIPASAWSVAIAPKGGFVVAGLGDGSVRWYRLDDGSERLNFYGEAATGRWVVWTPEGLFDHGPNGESLIGYHQNRMEGDRFRGVTFVRVEQLYSLLYRRDLVVKRLRGDSGAEIGQLVRRVGDMQTVLGRGMPPSIRLTEICGRIEGASRCRAVGDDDLLRGGQARVQPLMLEDPRVRLRFEVQERGGGRGAVIVRRQGASVPSESGPPGTAGNRIEERTVTLQPGLNVVALSAFNAASQIETDPGERPTIALRVKIPSNRKPAVHILAVGIDRFRNAAIPRLANAANDAKGVVTSLEGDSKRDVYATTHVALLTNEGATLKAITDGFEKLARATKPEDIAIIFLAGHGVALDGRYYFLPYDIPAMTEDAIRTHGLTHEQLAGHLGRLPTARTMVILDTCFSGNFAIDDSVLRESRDQTLGRQISHASGRFILAASSTQQEALDGLDGHGVFTGVLLRGLAGAADREIRGDRDGKVNVLEIGEFAKANVPVIARRVGKGHDQRPRWFFNGDDIFNVRSAD